MHEPANPLTRRLGQLVRMLASDQPGEVANAAEALNRTLASAGLDIHDLAKLAETGACACLYRPSSHGGDHRSL
jgi:hypothetical protein